MAAVDEADRLEEFKLTGDRGEFTVYLKRDVIVGMEDNKEEKDKFYDMIAKSQEIPVQLIGEAGRLDMQCTPWEYERIKTDPARADYFYKKLKEKLPFGPLRKYVPPTFWSKVSSKTLDSFLAKDEKDADKIRAKNPDVDIIVRDYCDKVFGKVMEKINDLGRQAMETMSPWLINTLIDLDDFDRFIMNEPYDQGEDDNDDYHEQRPEDDDRRELPEQKPEEDAFIWTTPRTATPEDRKAALTLIEILSSPEFDKKLKDKKSKKKIVWKEIAEELRKKGFKMNSDDPGEKVHQKWRNMEREYRSYIEHKKKTGEGRKKQPEFFEELHKMLSVRHSINPVAVADTTTGSATALCPSENTPSMSSANKSERKYVTPCSSTVKRKNSLKNEKNEEVINLIKSMHEENKKNEEKRFEREMEFFDNLRVEMASQHKDRMKATYDLIGALKKND